MGRIILPEVSASTTPPSGKVSVYAKTDGQLYLKNDAGVESPVGGGGGGSGLPSGGSVGQLLSLDGSSNPFWVDRPPGIAKIVASGRVSGASAAGLSVAAGSALRTKYLFVTSAPTGFGILRCAVRVKGTTLSGANGTAVERSCSFMPVVGPTTELLAYPELNIPYPTQGSPTGLLRALILDAVGKPANDVSLAHFDAQICVDFVFSRGQEYYESSSYPPTFVSGGTSSDIVYLKNIILLNRKGGGSADELDRQVRTVDGDLYAAKITYATPTRKVGIVLAQNASGAANTLKNDGGVTVEVVDYFAEWIPFPGTPNSANLGSFGSEIG